MSTQNLIEQLGYDLANKTLAAADQFYAGTVGVRVDHCFDGINRSEVSVNIALLRTQLAEYEAGLAPDSDYGKPSHVPAPIDQLTFDALNKILERTPDPTADFYVADTDTYFSTVTGTYFSHEHQAWLDSDYRTEQELRENYESVFNLLDVVEQVVVLEPQAQDREKWETSIPYAELMTAKQTWQHQQAVVDSLTAKLARSEQSAKEHIRLCREKDAQLSKQWDEKEELQKRVDAASKLANEWLQADAENDKARTLKGCAKRILKALQGEPS